MDKIIVTNYVLAFFNMNVLYSYDIVPIFITRIEEYLNENSEDFKRIQYHPSTLFLYFLRQGKPLKIDFRSGSSENIEGDSLKGCKVTFYLLNKILASIFF